MGPLARSQQTITQSTDRYLVVVPCCATSVAVTAAEENFFFLRQEGGWHASGFSSRLDDLKHSVWFELEAGESQSLSNLSNNTLGSYRVAFWRHLQLAGGGSDARESHQAHFRFSQAGTAQGVMTQVTTPQLNPHVHTIDQVCKSAGLLRGWPPQAVVDGSRVPYKHFLSFQLLSGLPNAVAAEPHSAHLLGAFLRDSQKQQVQ